MQAFAGQGLKKVIWDPGQSNCSVIYLNGSAMERIEDHGRVIDVFAPIRRDKHTFEVMVGVINGTKANIDVDPNKIGGFSDDFAQLPMASLDADSKIAKEERSQQRKVALGTAISAGSASLNTQNDPLAVNRAEAKGTAEQVAISNAHSAESNRVLRHNTLAPGSHIGGFVYMERPTKMDKKANIGTLVVDLEGTMYIFHYEKGAVPKVDSK